MTVYRMSKSDSGLVSPEDLQVGAFNKNPDEAKPGEEPEIYFEKHRIDQQETVITLSLDEKPTHVGIDPYNKLVDRNSDDNVKSTGS